jgi:hypoxanthine-guanine phosphoribosyltransferase|tara:strand:- start:119 stop:808 length:690 start_codon:yes stop_codon:yes gene_type:complete
MFSEQPLQHIRDYPGISRFDGIYSLGIYVQTKNWVRFEGKPKYKKDLHESKLVLSLKVSDHDAVEYFYKKLMPLTHLQPVIAAPPPSKDGQENSGIRSLIKRIVDKRNSTTSELIKKALQGGDPIHHAKQLLKHMDLTPNQIDDASRCLVRTETVPKHGEGERNKDVHLNSIGVRDRKPVDEKRVLLLDDVVTTGATMEACKQRLEEAGAAQVTMLALLRTYFRGKVER